MATQKIGIGFLVRQLRIASIPELDGLDSTLAQCARGRWLVFYEQRKEQRANAIAQSDVQKRNISTEAFLKDPEIPAARFLDPVVFEPGQQRVTDWRHAHIHDGKIKARVANRHSANASRAQRSSRRPLQCEESAAGGFVTGSKPLQCQLDAARCN